MSSYDESDLYVGKISILLLEVVCLLYGLDFISIDLMIVPLFIYWQVLEHGSSGTWRISQSLLVSLSTSFLRISKTLLRLKVILVMCQSWHMMLGSSHTKRFVTLRGQISCSHANVTTLIIFKHSKHLKAQPAHKR